ncbi:MAG TPA: GspL/Epsl periplasmic domain-containing protein, partial [Anaerolineales bacterium]
SLRRQQKEMGVDVAGLSASLGKISQALPQKENISMKEVSYESGRMRLSGEAGGAQQVEKFRTALAAAFGADMNVIVQESQGSARGGSIRFTILIEKGASGRAS